MSPARRELRQGGRLRLGMGGRLHVGMGGRLRRNPHSLSRKGGRGLGEGWGEGPSAPREYHRPFPRFTPCAVGGAGRSGCEPGLLVGQTGRKSRLTPCAATRLVLYSPFPLGDLAVGRVKGS